MENLSRQIEALLFAADRSLSAVDISEALEDVHERSLPLEKIESILSNLQKKYSSEEYSFEIVQISEGYRFLTKPAYHRMIKALLKQQNNKKLSRAAMETLSIIAYKQPVTKSEIEAIRGVNCDYTVSKLLDKEFITIIGRSDEIGQALLYGTSDKFLDHFGIHSLEDLPNIKDFVKADQEIGKPEDILEN